MILWKPESCYWYQCAVKRVVDGDTVIVDVDLGFRTWLLGRTVRLAKLWVPEAGTPDGDQCTRHLIDLVASAKETVLYSKRSDKYGRVLGNLFFDGHDASVLMANFLQDLQHGYR